MKNFLKIVSVYVGAFLFSSARMCGLYLIVIQICLYLYTEYGTSYQNLQQTVKCCRLIKLKSVSASHCTYVFDGEKQIWSTISDSSVQSIFSPKSLYLFVCLMVVNATSNNISVISWQSVLLVEETGGHRENHRHVASH